jgi:Ca2+-binding RTX toxin-like protein
MTKIVYNTATDYLLLQRRMIEALEGMDPVPADIGDGTITYGHGYTFLRNGKIYSYLGADLGAIGESLTADQVKLLKEVEKAYLLDVAVVDPENNGFRNTAIAIRNFTNTWDYEDLTSDEANTLFIEEAKHFTERIKTIFKNKLGTKAAADALYAKLEGTREWAAILCMGYVAETLLGTGFVKALASENRAEAWYQIRYGWGELNPKFNAGWAARHYMESTVFGLYNDPNDVTVDEAKSVITMFNSHRETKIYEREGKYGVLATGVKGLRDMINTDPKGAANKKAEYLVAMSTAGMDKIPTIVEALTPAYKAFVSYADGLIGSGVPSIDIGIISNAAAIYFTGDDATGKVLSAVRDDKRVGNNLSNNLLVGGSGNDSLTGGAGCDFLIGSAGNDVLDGGTENDTLVGGAGDDTLKGGAGDDKYYIGKDEGNDTISDSDLRGSIFINGGELSKDAVACKVGMVGTWGQDGGIQFEYSDKSHSLTISGGDLGNGKILLENFSEDNLNLAMDPAKGYLGIHLARPSAAVVLPIKEMPRNPFDDPAFNPNALPIPKTDLSAGGMGTYAFYLPYEAGSEGQQVEIELVGDTAATLRVLIGDTTVTPQNGTFTFTVAPGSKEATFTLISADQIDTDETVNVRATLIDPTGNVTYEPVELDTLSIKKGQVFIPPAQTVFVDSDGGFSQGSANLHVIGRTAADRIEMLNFGSNLIEGHGGQDVIEGGDRASQIFADKAVTIADAINSVAPATGIKGAYISGGNGDTLVVGNADNDFLMGNGNDTIIGGNGDNFILGHTDWISASSDWSATRRGDGSYAFSDIVGSSTPTANTTDYIYAGSGNNWIWTRYGDNYVSVKNGNNTVIGGSGDNNVVVGDGDNSIFATTVDLMPTNISQNYVEVGNGNNSINGGGGDGTYILGGGNDTVWGGAGDDYVEVRNGTGTNEIHGGEGDNTIYGGNGTTTIKADNGNNEINLGEGANTVVLGDGKNSVLGGDGINQIRLGDGANYVYVGKGDDVIQLGKGDNIIFAGDGNNGIWAGGGNNEIHAGDGNDYIELGNGNNTVYGGDGSDSIHGGSGNNVVYAGDGGTADAPLLVMAGDGNSTVYGGSGIDRLLGGAGNAVLYAGDGGTIDNPTIVQAGSGFNTLVAGGGVAQLIGGENTTFVLDSGNGDTKVFSEDGAQLFQFMGDLQAEDLTLSAELYADNTSALVVNYGGGNATIVGGLTGGADNMAFEGSGAVGLAQVMQQGTVIEQDLAGDGFDLMLSATEGAVLQGSTANSTIIAFGADAVLIGGAGISALSGGGGGDVYIANATAKTTVSNSVASDRLQLAAGVVASDVTATTADLNGKPVITIHLGKGTGNGGTVIVDGSRGTDLLSVVRFADGSTTTLAQLLAQSSGGTGTTTNVDGSYSTTSGDGNGNVTTTGYDVNGNKLSDSWAKSDGSHGTETYNAYGYTSTTVNVDGSYINLSVNQDNSGDVRSETFDAAGRKIGDSWQKSDGSYGTDVFGTDGASSGVVHFADGGYDRYSNDGKGDIDTVSYDASGKVISESTTSDNSSSNVVNDDGHGNATTIFYDTLGKKQSDHWVHADGSHGSDNFHSDGSSTGVTYRADGTYSTYADDGDGQSIAKNFGWNGLVLGASTTQTNGQGNSITSNLNNAGAKLSETWAHSDGQTGSDAIQSTDYLGGANMAALDWPNEVKSYWREQSWIPHFADAYRDNYKFADDGIGVFADYQTSISDPAADNYINYFFQSYSGGTQLDVQFWDYANHFNFEVYLDTDGKTYLYSNDGNYSPIDPKVAMTRTVSGEHSTTGTYKQDGQGNAEVTIRDANGRKIEEMWVHNDGSNGDDVFRADGSSYGFFSGVHGEVVTYTADAAGHVDKTIRTSDQSVQEPYVAPPIIALPRAPRTLNSAPSSSGGWQPLSFDVRDVNGNVTARGYYDEHGGITLVQLDQEAGGSASFNSVHTDPEIDAGVVVNGQKLTWRYDLGGMLLSRSSDDGQGNVSMTDFDQAGHVKGTRVVKTDPQGAVMTKIYDAAGHFTGSTIATAIKDGRVDTTMFNAIGTKTGSSFSVTDENGNSVSSVYDATGALLSSNTLEVTDDHAVTMTSFDAIGFATGATVTATSADGAIRTSNYDANGALIDSVVAIVDPNGNVKTSTYDATGASTGYVKLASDGHNNTTIIAFDAGSNRLRSDLLKANGVEVNASYHADGSTTTTTRQVDGSYAVVSDDGRGNVLTSNYTTADLLVGDVWTLADGSSGTDAMNADGTYTGSATYLDGTTSAIVKDGLGQLTTTHFASDGSTVTGSSVTTPRRGGTLTTNYDAAGNRISDAWRLGNGTSGSDVFNADGTSSGTTMNPDGSYNTYTDDGKGEIRTINFDSNGGATGDPVITHANQAPQVRGPIDNQVTDEAQPFSFVIPATTFADPNAGDVLSYKVALADGTALPAWLAFNAQTGTLSGTPANADNGILAINVTATDPGGLSASTGFSLTINNVNGAPVVANPIGDRATDQAAPFSFLIPASTMTDDDVGDILSYGMTQADGSALPAWLAFDATNGALSGTPPDAGVVTLKLTATDVAGLSATTSFKLTINHVNQAPVLANLIADQTTDEAKPFVLVVPANMFTDRDAGDALTYSFLQSDGRELPSWLAFDPATGTLSGTPADADTGLLHVKMVATDIAGLEASTVFNLTVNNINQAPVLSSPVADQAAAEDTLFSFVIPANTFTDPDAGDTLHYQVKQSNGNALPSWLVFNPDTHTFGGTPTHDDVGSLTLKVTAADSGGLLQSNIFSINVAAAPDQILVGTAAADVLVGGTGGDLLQGLAGNDSLSGGIGNDTLDGGSGADSMRGGTGNDVYVVDYAGDVVIESANAGTDLVQSSISYTLGANVENLTLTGSAGVSATGNDLNNLIVGNAGANVINGGGGIDTLMGGAGNDTYVINNSSDVIVENADQGMDTVKSSVTIALAANLENLVLVGTSFINGTGNESNNSITGNIEDNILIGNGGNDTLYGGGGADTMVGGTGNDTFVVTSLDNVIVEMVNEGTDTVKANIAFTLGANFENLTLTGTAGISGTGNDLNNAIIGNGGNNLLTGNAGNDTLNGGAGADTMIGGTGNDTYVVDDAGDVLIENANEGTDTVKSGITYALLSNFENLVLTGVNPIDGTGNELNNSMTGNAGNNVLVGNAGNDILNGGTGSDTLIGGTGNDVYIVDNAGDVIKENVDEGSDLVKASVSYALAANIENLALTGVESIDGAGNELNNSITGNGGANRLLGNGGDDTLNGGAGADTMLGGTGSDTYYVDNANDVIVENAGEGNDQVKSSVSYVLSANIEQLTLTGTADVTGSGNDQDNLIVGNAGNHTLVGGGGNDTLVAGTGRATLIGGSGNNTYVVNNVADVIIAEANSGLNSVLSSVQYVLPANVQNLTLTGTAALAGTGNALSNIMIGNGANNILTGGAGDDVLDGKAGADTLIGGSGNVTFVVDNVGDVILAQANAGLNTVLTSVNLVMPENVANLNVTGTRGLAVTGNGLNNIINGNVGNDVLTGGAGIDVLDGGAGSDTLKNLTGKGVLSGGAGNDVITAGTEANFIIGGAGNDTISIGTSSSVIGFNRGDGQDIIKAIAGGSGVVSLGGGIDYDKLAFSKSGNNLVLNTGGTDSITFQNWYASTSNHNIVSLQVMEEASASFDAGSSDSLRNKKIEDFNFVQLVADFDAARAANSTLSSWNLMDSLLSRHLSGSDSTAKGGDLAYTYGVKGSLSGVDMAAAVATVQDPQFGKLAQTLNGWPSISQGVNALR